MNKLSRLCRIRYRRARRGAYRPLSGHSGLKPITGTGVCGDNAAGNAVPGRSMRDASLQPTAQGKIEHNSFGATPYSRVYPAKPWLRVNYECIGHTQPAKPFVKDRKMTNSFARFAELLVTERG